MKFKLQHWIVSKYKYFFQTNEFHTTDLLQAIDPIYSMFNDFISWYKYKIQQSLQMKMEGIKVITYLGEFFCHPKSDFDQTHLRRLQRKEDNYI